jgi:nitroreductase
MTFLGIVKLRRSVRRYKPDPVPRELVEKCLEAARYSPSACNTQCFRFIIAERAMKNRLVSECLGEPPVPNRWAAQAPVIAVLAVRKNIVTHTVGGNIKGTRYDLLDAGIAGEHFVLQAAELGLGICWLVWFRKGRVRKLLGIPGNWDIAAMITLGYVDEEPGEIARIPMDEIREYRE